MKQPDREVGIMAKGLYVQSLSKDDILVIEGQVVKGNNFSGVLVKLAEVRLNLDSSTMAAGHIVISIKKGGTDESNS